MEISDSKMAKMHAVLFLFLIGFLSVESLRFDPPQIRSGGKLFAGSNVPNIIPNDPRCTRGNGVFGNSEDCTSYYACNNGTGQDRKCPKGMKFHRIKHCTLDEVDCVLLQNSENASDDFECPDDYGMFPYPRDCHKYVICLEATPFIHTCPEDQIYQDNVGCIEGNVCPQTQHSNQKSMEEEQCLLPPEIGSCEAKIPRFYYDINTGRCQRFLYGGCHGNANNFKTKRECEIACLPRLPTQNSERSKICISRDSVIPNRFTCSRYTQCVDFIPTTIVCPKGEGFSSKKERCVKFEQSDCNRNSVLNILED